MVITRYLATMTIVHVSLHLSSPFKLQAEVKKNKNKLLHVVSLMESGSHDPKF